MTAPISVLYVDDDAALLDLARQFIEAKTDGIAVETADSAPEGLDRLERESFDAVVSDYQMPEMDGLEFLRKLREERGSTVPFIVFTGRGREEVAIEALNLGADRYLQKGGDPTSQYRMLVQAIEQEVSHNRTQSKLEAREEHLRITLDSIGDAVIATDETGTVERINDVAEELTGWDRSEAVGTPLSDIFRVSSHETGEPIETPFEEVLDTGTTIDLANGTVLHRPDGTERYIADSAAPITDDDEIVGVVIVFRDVTDQYRRKRRQREQRETVIDLSTDPAVVEGYLEEATEHITRAAAETLGVDRSSLWLFGDDHESMRCVDLYDRTDGAHESGTVLDATEYPDYFEALSTHRSIPAVDARQDPRTSGLSETYLEPLGVESMLDATVRRGGEVIGVLCNETVGERREWTDDEVRFTSEVADQFVIAMDNDAQRQRERALERQNRELELLFDQSPMGVVELTPSFEVARWNERASDLFGYPADDVVGSHVGVLSPDTPRERVDETWRALTAANDPDPHVQSNVTAEGDEREFEWHVRTIADDGDTASVLAFVFRRLRPDYSG